MANQVSQKTISDFLVETLLNCDEKCITKNEDGITISLPEDRLTQEFTEKIREKIYSLLEKPDFIEKLSKAFSKKNDEKFKGFIVKDLDGFVIHLKRSV